MAVAIDAHAHVIVPELLRDGAPDERWRPSVAGDLIELSGRRVRSIVHPCVEVDEILAALDLHGTEGVLLSPWVPLLFYDVDAEEGLRRCRLQNDGLASMRRRAPGRVSVLGAVPLQDPRLAAQELDRLMSTGSFAGIEVTASINGNYLGESRFEPFWAAAEEHDALVFVHPTTRAFADGVFEQHYLWNLVGNPFETTVAAAHLLLTGTMGRHPRLRLLLAHGGGAIVSLLGRIRHGQATVGAAGPASGPGADELIGRFLFDTVVHDAGVLGALVAAVGADRVLLGSDYPFDMGDPDPVATVRAAGLDPEAEDAVLRANAAREIRGADG